jgi:phosphoglucosamine mutase
VADTANGAASLFGAGHVRTLGRGSRLYPLRTGRKNINLNSGALHVETLQKRVVERGATMGSLSTATQTGPCSYRIPARSWMGTVCFSWKRVTCNPRAAKEVISTVMSNLASSARWRATASAWCGLRGRQVRSGEMIRRDALLGGEQSGRDLPRVCDHG